MRMFIAAVAMAVSLLLSGPAFAMGGRVVDTPAQLLEPEKCMSVSELIERIRVTDERRGRTNTAIKIVRAQNNVDIVTGALSAIYETVPAADSYMLTDSPDEVTSYLVAFKDGCRIYGRVIGKKSYDAIVTTINFIGEDE